MASVTETGETPITPAEAIRDHIPGNINPSTFTRWYLKGLRPDPEADAIKLGVQFVGGRVWTTPESVKRFFDQITEAKRQRIARVRLAADVDAEDLAEVGLSDIASAANIGPN